MNWKPVLYEYVRAANERESDPGAGAEFLPAAERARLRRARDGREQRGARALGSDAVLSLRQVRESEREAIVDIELRRTLQLRTRGLAHAEERVDRERVTLQRTPGAEWFVARAEPIVQERRGGGPSTALGTPPGGAAAVQAAPFLNERLLTRPTADGGGLRAYAYDREAARAYAERHWNEPNPQFIHFDVDCTNYVSQCLYAGGAPMNYTGVRESGWWYKGKSGGRELWSYSWTVAHALHWYLMGKRADGLRGEQVGSAGELTIGDVICYDFDGDGRFEHSVIVTGADGAGQPLVNAHTSNSRGRYWDYKDSYAWTDRTTYRFFRILDGN